MLVNTFILAGLVISALLIMFLFVFIKKQERHTKLKFSFMCILICLLICCTGLIAQILFSKALNIKPIYFEYIVYIGTVFLPISLIVMCLDFTKPNNKINVKPLILKLSIVPIICLIALWTNDFHHLFYREYSIMLSEANYGPFFYITSAYTYLLLGIVLIRLIIYSIKNIKLYFIQALLIFIGVSIPLIVNIFGLLGIFDMYIYMTPMYFSFSILCFAISIFRFGFLKISPVTLKNIVNRISDSYIILNKDMIIADFNEPLLKTFNVTSEDIINKNIFEIKHSFIDFNTISKKLVSAAQKIQTNNETILIDKYFKHIDKYFHLEITGITENGSFLGTLILLKDVTQHNLDLQTIQNNQDILIERERLASLGQMIGGIAHNLKTPIMSISGAAEGISDLIDEYSSSIGDPEVTKEDHLEIAKDMRNWISKIQSHLAYMSDVITTVKGQAVTFSDNASYTDFTIDDLIRQINILMKHELNHALLELKEDIQIDKNTSVKGNINSLVQVINNIISNAIQAYNGKTGEQIILSIYKQNNNQLIISIKDFAGGLPESVKNKLFKEMITTKGKAGTGLGLFMSYSNIKAHFNGDITFDTEQNKGTTFYIHVPL